MRKFIIAMVFCILWMTVAEAIEIYLTNGDKVTGVVLRETDRFVVLKTLGAGEIKLDKAFIDRQKTYPQEYGSAPQKQDPQEPLPSQKKTAPEQKIAEISRVEEAIVWNKKLALGYTQSGGNTTKRQGMLSSMLNRKNTANESTMKFDVFYSSSSGKMDAKKFYGMLRYAYSFGKNLKSYIFYKLEGDQDRFADIHYRFIPSLGNGYWFSDTEDLKLMTELAVGYQYTNYRHDIKSTGESVLVPRFFLDKRLIENLHLSEDLTFYPSLEDLHEYRFKSETSLVNKINERWSCRIQFVDEFNSNPMGTAKENDYRWITSLDYNF
jgi:putative salt-induced outer membrane protein YdiY